MSRPRISLIAAVDRALAIGRDGDMPWHLPADLAFFKRTTLGHPVVMGRTTYESIGRPLPGRDNRVLSSQAATDERVGWHRSLDEAIGSLVDATEVFIIGGAQVYRAALPSAQRVYLTRIDTWIRDADTFFPVFETHGWHSTTLGHRAADERNAFALAFVRFERDQPA